MSQGLKKTFEPDRRTNKKVLAYQLSLLSMLVHPSVYHIGHLPLTPKGRGEGDQRRRFREFLEIEKSQNI